MQSGFNTGKHDAIERIQQLIITTSIGADRKLIPFGELTLPFINKLFRNQKHGTVFIGNSLRLARSGEETS